MVYRKEIDGLRAIAVIPVILFHAGFETFGGGFAGVDIFFVISGYLITSIIIDELNRDQFTITGFYYRRARRILPPLFFLLLICIPLSWFSMLPEQYKDFSKSIFAVVLFISNILFNKEAGYFDTANEVKPLLHAWSLSVEEQFYLFFPPLLMLLWKFKVRYQLAALLILLIISLTLSQIVLGIKPSSSYFLFYSRSWELLCGGICAYYLYFYRRENFSKKASEVGSWAGAILIIFTFLFYEKSTPFPGMNAVPVILGTILLILFATEFTSLGRLLSFKFFVSIGLLSYSAYLWHQPVFAYARLFGIFNSEFLTKIFIILAIFIISYISWRHIESHFRNGNKVSNNKIKIVGLCISSLLILIAFAGYKSNGFPYRFPLLQQINNQLLWPESYNHDSECLTKFGGDQYCKLYDIKSTPTALLLGDSHANHFFIGLADRLAIDRSENLLMFGSGGCPPFLDIDVSYHPVHKFTLHCNERLNIKFKELLALSSIKDVFISFHPNNVFDKSIKFIDIRNEIDFESNRSFAIRKAILRTIEYASSHGKNIYFIEDLPDVTFTEFQNCLIKKSELNEALACLRLEEQNHDYQYLLKELYSYNVTVIRTNQLLEYFPFTDKGDLIYRDSTHLTSKGSLYIGKNIELIHDHR